MGPSAYQPDALLLGQTGSLEKKIVQFFCFRNQVLCQQKVEILFSPFLTINGVMQIFSSTSLFSLFVSEMGRDWFLVLRIVSEIGRDSIMVLRHRKIIFRHQIICF